MIYLDTSAASRLFVDERGSDALRSWLFGQSEACCTSAVGAIELERFGLRMGGTVNTEVQIFASSLFLIDLSPAIAELSKRIAPSNLRTLDAIHLATMVMARGSLSAVATYDEALGVAAGAFGLVVTAPE